MWSRSFNFIFMYLIILSKFKKYIYRVDHGQKTSLITKYLCQLGIFPKNIFCHKA